MKEFGLEYADVEVENNLRELRGNTIDPTTPVSSIEVSPSAPLPIPLDRAQPGDKEVQDIEYCIRRFDEDNVGPDEGASGSEDEELFDGNRAPPEFYRQHISTTNVNNFKRRHHSRGTLKLI